MENVLDVLLPPDKAPSAPAPLPRGERGDNQARSQLAELGEGQARSELTQGSAGFCTSRFREFRVGPDVQWLWPGRIPLGMVTLIEGVEGAGKSFVALDVAARVSSGAGWPGLPEANRAGVGSESKREVLVLCRSDDCRSAGRRLAAMGADLRQIRRLERSGRCEPNGNENGDQALAFPRDLPAIEAELRRGTLGLVVIDSLADFCPLPQQVAETLRRLNELAEEFNVAIVVTLPANCRCDGQGALKVTSRYRTGGARCVWTVLADPDVPSRRVFVARRTNFCEEPAGLEFRFQDGRIAWGSAAQIKPDDPLGLQAGISLCLAEALRDGYRAAAEVLREGQQCGFTPKQLRCAAKRLGIKSYKSTGYGADGSWAWWTSEQWAQRLARLEMIGTGNIVGEILTSADQAPPAADAARASSDLAASDLTASDLAASGHFITPDGILERCVAMNGKELEAQYLARQAALAQATTPPTAAAAGPAPADVSQTAAASAHPGVAPARQPQAGRSKNRESLEKQGENQCHTSGPLPRDRYARQQERKRRERERLRRGGG